MTWSHEAQLCIANTNTFGASTEPQMLRLQILKGINCTFQMESRKITMTGNLQKAGGIQQSDNLPRSMV